MENLSMNFLDMRTILVGLWPGIAVSALVVFLLWVQNRRRFPGIHYWVLSFFAQALGLLLILLRGNLSAFISMTLSNTLVILGGLLAFWGVKDFAGLTIRRGVDLIVLTVCFLFLGFFTLAVPDLRWRGIVLCLGLFYYTFRGAWLIFRRLPREMSRILLGVGLVFAFFAALSLMRFAYFLTTSPSNQDFFRSGGIEPWVMLAYQGLEMLLAYTLILAINRRLLMDIGRSEEKFSKAFRSSPYALMLTRLADGRIQEVNDGFVRLSGYSREEALGKTTQELRLWAKEEERSIFTDALLQNGRMEGREFLFRIKSGELLIGMVSAEVLKINEESFILASVRDITASKKAEEALKESEERYRKVVENASEAILVAQEGRITFHNRRTEELIGYSDEELQSRPFTDFIHPEDRELVLQRYLERLKGDDVPPVYPFRVIDQAGNVRWVEINAVSLSWEGKPATLNFLNDITQRKIMEEQLQEMTIRDELTGLYNRRGFITLAEQQLKIEERRKKKLVLYFADLDRMKWINDHLGHQEGDRALQDASRILKETFRDADIIGRMGGDEFAVLALDVDGVDPGILIERLGKTLEAFREKEERPYRLSLSVGYAEYDPNRPLSLDQLLAEADYRMYEQKRNKNLSSVQQRGL